MTAQSKLWQVALDQFGFVTTADARALDIAPVTVRQLVYRGHLEPAAHGVYRFVKFPNSQFDSFMLAVLWAGKPGVRLGFETALANFEVCDINPTRIHLCVPRKARVRRRGGEIYELHSEDVPEDEQQWWNRIPSVSFNLTLDQCARMGVPRYLLRQAVTNGSSKGLLTSAQSQFWDTHLSLLGE